MTLHLFTIHSTTPASCLCSRPFPPHQLVFKYLKLCPGGTLFDYLRDNTVIEGQLRGVLRSLVEALIYLKKQGVVHRNIQPTNILLTSDNRIKLSDFGLATRLPPSAVPIDYFMKAPHYVAPEILAGSPYSCDADSWSLGCLAIACLSGQRPFEAISVAETVNKIFSSAYTLPTTISLEMQDLAVKLLETDSSRRIQLSAALSHPFFDVNLPVIPLDSSLPTASENLRAPAPFQPNAVLSRPQLALFPPRHTAIQKQKRHSHAGVGLGRRKAALDEIISDLGSTRRIVSDPLPKQDSGSEAGPSHTSSSSQCDTSPQQRQRAVSIVSTGSPVCEPDPLTSRESSNTPPLTSALSSMRHGTIPVGTMRPSPFTTALLHPEVHKTVHGQITVLPSRSLLVDLREGERKRGQAGTEVFVIDPRGVEIKVYSAPHLSRPCCLAEPSGQYTIETLPSSYWRQYNDAGLLVERIKERTPKLTLLAGGSKCTLMANAPTGEVELLFSGFRPSPAGQVETSSVSPQMRIRLSRRLGSVEIATHISGERGEEWTKKVLKTVDEHHRVSTSDWDALDATERNGMTHLNRFLTVCATVERLETEGSSVPTLDGSSGNYESRRGRPGLQNTRTVVPSVEKTSSSSQTLSILNLAPRPPKLPYLTSTRRNNRIHSANDFSTQRQNHSATPIWCKDDLDVLIANRCAPQTKFIPSVGWCIRQSSRVSQGGRYKLMFFDGTSLEIDVDEDWAEFTNQLGEVTRHSIRECNSRRKIAERMKVFGDFVSMFDETGED
ncbi:hypothetical protein C8J57DRAFT_1706856 [Mycena rebaudengoi]|nr:hypothetical protein C8J57DRAFT_1706856 [Mycena rebaudengoi]